MSSSMAVDADAKGGSADSLYHERQHFQFCLLHCLNNLLQGSSSHFTRKELDVIADSLPSAADASQPHIPNPLTLIFKPHRNAVTGNYDANVLTSALASRGKQVLWFDSRKGVEGLLSQLALHGERLVGMVVNFSTTRFFGLVKGRHWVAVKKVEGVWYDLDSDKGEPVSLGGGEEGVRAYLENVISSGGVVIFVLN